MATIDLSNYNLGELKGLEFEIEKELKARRQQEVKQAREQILAIARDAGLPVEDLLGNTGAKSKRGGGATGQRQDRNRADQA